MNSRSILFETDQFNLSDKKPHLKTSHSFGEDVASWVQAKLSQHGITVHPPGQGAGGWSTGASLRGTDYLIAIDGSREENHESRNYGEWKVRLEKKQSFWEKLRGKNPVTDDDPLLELLLRIIKGESGFVSVRVE